MLAQTAVFDALDPALAYAPGSTAIAGLTGDGLTATQRAAGRDAAQVVPDLAVTLPRPQDGGRTYRFVLRSGIRYSTGGEVRATDVRPSFERIWKLRPFADFTSPGRDFFAVIVGADQCRRKPRTCDLSRGIVTEPGNDAVVTFHLSRPDPEFVYKLVAQLGVHPAGGNTAARADSGPCRPPAHTPWRALTEPRARADPQPGVRGVVAGRPAGRLPRSDRTAPQRPAGPRDPCGHSRASRHRARRSVLAHVRKLLTQHAGQTHVEPRLGHGLPHAQHADAAIR